MLAAHLLPDLHNIRGRVFGIDAETCKPVWQIFTVPKQEGDILTAPEGKMPTEEMRATWGNPPDVPISGGGTWTSDTLYTETGYLYIPIGNPAPDFVSTLRPGSNLLTNTLVVADAKTGNYVKRYDIMADDWHDWDMSNPPTLYTSRGGRKLLSFHPKDGHLYTYDRATDEQLCRNPVTKQLNTDIRFEPNKPIYFCPGSVGGGEWKWRARTNYPVLSGVTPTAGGVVFFGDMGGNFRAMRASDGQKLYHGHFEGAFAGGIIAYAIDGTQRVAAMSGVAHPQWPVKPSTGKILVFRLG